MEGICLICNKGQETVKFHTVLEAYSIRIAKKYPLKNKYKWNQTQNLEERQLYILCTINLQILSLNKIMKMYCIVTISKTGNLILFNTAQFFLSQKSNVNFYICIIPLHCIHIHVINLITCTNVRMIINCLEITYLIYVMTQILIFSFHDHFHIAKHAIRKN